MAKSKQQKKKMLKKKQQKQLLKQEVQAVSQIRKAAMPIPRSFRVGMRKGKGTFTFTDEEIRAVKMMILPEDCDEPVLLPVPGDEPRSVVRVKRPFSLAYVNTNGGLWTVKLRPILYDSIGIANITGNWPAPGAPVPMSAIIHLNGQVATTTMVGNGLAFTADGSSQIEFDTTPITSGGITRAAIPIPYTAVAGNATGYVLCNRHCTLTLWTLLAGVWTNNGNITCIPGTTAGLPFPNAAETAFALTINNATNGGGGNIFAQVNCSFQQGNVSNGERMRGLFSHDTIELGKITRYRITAMSLRATNISNYQNRGGNCTALRVDGGQTGEDGITSPAVDALAKNPMAASLTLDHGAYLWWLPAEMNSIDLREPGTETIPDIVSYPELIVAAATPDNQSVVKITASMVIEFVSQTQVFNRKRTEIDPERWAVIQAWLQSQPSAMENPEHEAWAQALLGALKTGARTLAHAGIEYVGSHPELVDTALEALAGLILA